MSYQLHENIQAINWMLQKIKPAARGEGLEREH